MAGQKPAARQGQARSRQNQSRNRQGAAAATPKPNDSRNRPAAGKSRPASSAAASPRSASAAGTGRAAAAREPAGSAPSGPLGKLLAPFRTVGGVPLATFVLSLYALGASVYLTITHYDANVTLACSDKGLVNCAEVTSSAQSMVFGIFPVAVLGLAFYVFMTVLNSPWVWRLQQTGPERLSSNLRYLRIGSIVVGMGFVLYLIYAELIQIGAICLWCTSVHVATFLIFALIVFYTTFSSGPQARPGRG